MPTQLNKKMKKLLLLPLLFIAFSCDTDEMEKVGNTIDPFIGTWDLENLNGCSFDTLRHTIKSDGTWENSDGWTGYWLNLGDDFNNYEQTYRLTVDENRVVEGQELTQEYSVIFDDDWNAILFEFDCGYIQWIKISD